MSSALKVGDRLMSVFGIEPSAISAALIRAVRSFRDKSQRLSAIEVACLVKLEYHDALTGALIAVKGDSPGVIALKNTVQTAMLRADRNVSIVLARAADRDGSIESGG